MLTFAKKYASSTYSQNGEDGIIAEICSNRLKYVKTGLCCEFGAADGKQFSNTAALIEKGWEGLMVEADTELYKQCLQNWQGNNNVSSVCAHITPQNVNRLVPHDLDLLSIDIEESCYKVWEAFEHKPVIVIIEINSDLRPDIDHVSPEKGANYSAMVKLGQKKGYTLICHVGNLIFIKDEYNKHFPEVFGTDHATEPFGSLEIIDPLDRIDLYFNSSWLPADMQRPWEQRAQPATSINTPNPYPIINPDAPAMSPPTADENVSSPIVNRQSEIVNPTIGILVTATGNFLDFIPALHASLQHFCPGYKKTLYLFTDKPTATYPDTEIIPVMHKPFPFISLDRYSRYMKFGQRYAHHDYLFHIDADMLIVNVGPEILKPLLAVQHPLFPRPNGELGSWEENPESTAYVPAELRKVYVCGGIQGGQAGKWLQVCGTLARRIQEDYDNEKLAIWHDESHWNWYTAHYPEGLTILDPGYCYPQEKTIPYEKHIIALDKDKTFYR